MSGGFGQYDTGGGSGAKMPTAIYDLVIIDADVKRDGRGDVIRDPKSEKARFAAILEVVHGPFKGEKIKRTMNVTYAASQDGNYGPFAQFIFAATGLPCGDARQKSIGRDDLRGRVVRALVKHANGYNNVTEFVTDAVPESAPPAHVEAPAAAPAAQRSAPPATARPAAATAPQSPPLDHLLSNVPFPIAQQIRALGKWAQLNDAQLAVKIGFFAGRDPLSIDDVEKLKEKIKAERAA